MEIKLRQRLIGAVVLAALIVIFVPTLFNKSSNTSKASHTNPGVSSEAIPAAPAKPQMQTIQNAQEDSVNQEANKILMAGNSNPNTSVSSPDSTASPASQTVQQTTASNDASAPASRFSNDSVFAPENAKVLPAAVNNQVTQITQDNQSAQNQSSNNNPANSVKAENQSKQQSSLTPNQTNSQDNVIVQAQQKVTLPNSLESASSVISQSEPAKTVTASKREKQQMQEKAAVAKNASQEKQAQLEKTAAAKNEQQIRHEQLEQRAALVKKSIESSLPMHEKKVSSEHAYILHLGTFSDAANAQTLVKKLRERGFTAFTREIKTADGKNMTRVFAGPEVRRKEVEALQARLANEMHVKGLIEPFNALRAR